MKENVLSLSIAAMIGGLGLGLSGTAMAGLAYEIAAVGGTDPGTLGLGATNATVLEVSADGIGHNLLVPYYSVQEGNGTLLSIVNTDLVNGKALKVRFRGASNSDDVFDFSLFMSPGDVWIANVSKDATTGKAQLRTPDNTCSLPRHDVINVTAFVTDRVYGADDTAKAGETLEGHVEIFNMADIPPQVPSAGGVASDAGTAASAIANPLFTAIKHTSAGTNPCSLATSDATLPAAVAKLKALPTLFGFLEPDYVDYLINPAADRTALLAHGLWTPTTGLTGSWAILNIAGASVAWSGNMTAIEARAAAGGAPARGRVVFSPQKDGSVGGYRTNQLTADPLMRSAGGDTDKGIIDAAPYDLPDMSTPYLTAQALADAGGGNMGTANTTSHPGAQANLLTKALAVKHVINEYLTNPQISAATDWVFSMPTRRYAVGVNYKNVKTANSPLVFNVVGPSTQMMQEAISPYFTSANTRMGAGGDSGNPEYQACVEPNGDVTAYDQEEAVASGNFVISPGTVTRVVFCGETSVLTFNKTSSLKGKIATKDIDVGFKNGWVNINTKGNASGDSFLGLPIIGSSFVKMTGPAASGKSTNFSITQPRARTGASARSSSKSTNFSITQPHRFKRTQ